MKKTIILMIFISMIAIVFANASCIDTDNGKNFTNNGSVTFSSDPNTYCVFTDNCYNTNILKEYYCFNGTVRYIYYNCGTTGCNLGACKASTPGPSGSNTVYSGALSSGWTDKSWGATVDIASSEQSTGTKNIKLNAVAWGGLQLESTTMMNAANYQSLQFRAYTASPITIDVRLTNGVVDQDYPDISRDLVAGWNTVTISMSELDPAAKQFNNFWIQNYESASNTIYVADIKFLTTGNSGTVCTAGTIKTGDVCQICNNAGTGYQARCQTGQTCNPSTGACTTPATCTAGVVNPTNKCQVCNAAGTAYAAKCTSTQTCNTATGACTNNQPQSTCTAGTTNPNNICQVCNSAGSSYVAKCTSTQTCNTATGACTTAQCTDTCVSLGLQCGTQTICGTSQTCGTCTLSGQTCNSGICGVPGSTGMWVTTYYSSWDFGGKALGSDDFALPIENVDWTLFNHVVHFGNSNVDGNTPAYLPAVANSDSYCEWKYGGGNGCSGSDTQTPMIAAAHAHGVKVLVSVVSVDGTSLTQIAKSQSKVDTFSAQVAQYVKDHNYDGIEVDWEFWMGGGDATSADVTRLYTGLRNALNSKIGPQALMISSAGGGQATLYPAALDSIIDQYVLQLYDCTNAWSDRLKADTAWYINALYMGNAATELNDAHFEGCSLSDRIASWEAAGHDKKKLSMGLATFPRVFTGIDKTYVPIQGQPAEQKYKYALDALKKGGVMYWDDQRKVNYIAGTATGNIIGNWWAGTVASSGQKFFITLSTPQSAQYDVQWAKANGIGGIMTYEYIDDMILNSSSPYKNSHPVMEAIRDAMKS